MTSEIRLGRMGTPALILGSISVLLSTQLLLSHRALGKAITWGQALGWSLPLALGTTLAVPSLLGLIRRPWPARAAPRAAFQGSVLLGLSAAVILFHVGLSLALGWMPRQWAILPYELRLAATSLLPLAGACYLVLLTKSRTPADDPAIPVPDPSTPPAHLVAWRGNRRQPVAIADICRVQAAGNYVRIHAAGAVLLLRVTMRDLERRLGDGFARIHRSHLVNRDQVDWIKPRPSGDYDVGLRDGSVVGMSRRFRHRLLAPGEAVEPDHR